jgi:hypothetical protein
MEKRFYKKMDTKSRRELIHISGKTDFKTKLMKEAIRRR